MIREIKNNLYRITIYGICTNTFIEAETKEELFKYISEQENKGNIITSINLIQPNGKTPKIAFKTDKEYKAIKNKL